MDGIPMTPPRLVITGANGFTGRHACRHFAARGYEVTAVLRQAQAEALPCPAVRCDLTDPGQVNETIGRLAPDAVLHLAGSNSVADSWREPARFFEANVMSTVYLLDAVRVNSLEQCTVLIVGSMLNFSLTDRPEPPNPYSFSKTFQVAVARSWTRLFGTDIRIAQPSNLIGPGASNGICGLLARRAAALERGADQPEFRLSSTVERRDFLDVRDAVAAYRVILEGGEAGQTYPVGSGAFRSLGELLGTVQTFAGVPLEVQAGNGGGPDPDPLDHAPMKALGWEPTIPFEQSVQDALRYFRSRP